MDKLDREVVHEVIDMLRNSAVEEAIFTLERHFLPKWGSVQECRAAVAVNGEKMGGISDQLAKALVMQGAV